MKSLLSLLIGMCALHFSIQAEMEMYPVHNEDNALLPTFQIINPHIQQNVPIIVSCNVDADGNFLEILNIKLLSEAEQRAIINQIDSYKYDFDTASSKDAFLLAIKGVFDFAQGSSLLIYIGGKKVFPYVASKTKRAVNNFTDGCHDFFKAVQEKLEALDLATALNAESQDNTLVIYS